MAILWKTSKYPIGLGIHILLCSCI